MAKEKSIIFNNSEWKRFEICHKSPSGFITTQEINYGELSKRTEDEAFEIAKIELSKINSND